MKSYISASLALMVSTFVLGDIAFSQPSGSKNIIQRPYLYRVTKGVESHYILGTFHVVVQWNELPQQVRTHFETANTVILETDYSEQSRRSIKLSFKHLAPLIPTEVTSPLDSEKLRKLGYPEALIKTAADADCFGLIYYPHMNKTKYPLYQLDADIYFQAKDGGKKIVKLDTVKILAEAATYEEKHDDGQCSAKKILANWSVEQILSIGQNALDQYRSGNLDLVASQDSPSVVYRNHSWMPTILQSFDHGSSFLAVGVDHLFGGNGILSLLEKQGYTTHRM